MDKDMELKLDMLATMQKTCALLDHEMGICGINENRVHLTENAFRAAFPDVTEEKPYLEKFKLLETEYNGVKFIALVVEENDVQMS